MLLLISFVDDSELFLWPMFAAFLCATAVYFRYHLLREQKQFAEILERLKALKEKWAETVVAKNAVWLETIEWIELKNGWPDKDEKVLILRKDGRMFHAIFEPREQEGIHAFFSGPGPFQHFGYEVEFFARIKGPSVRQ